jgi:hypothetical protein
MRGLVGAALQPGRPAPGDRRGAHRLAGALGTRSAGESLQGQAAAALVREPAVGHADAGDGRGHRHLSSVLLCSVPPNQASFLQRMGRAGRRDGNAMTTTLADGNSPHDLYFFAETEEMIAGEVAPPGVFLQAAEVLRRQLFAFCMDDWVARSGQPERFAGQDIAGAGRDGGRAKLDRFPYLFMRPCAGTSSACSTASCSCLTGCGRCGPRAAVGLHAGPGRGGWLAHAA